MQFSSLALSFTLSLSLVATSSAMCCCAPSNQQPTVEKYLAAQALGRPDNLPILPWLYFRYTENGKEMNVSEGILSHPMRIDWNQTIYDAARCQSFTELVSNNGNDSYVIGMRMLFNTQTLSTELGPGTTIIWMNATVTKKGDPFFDAASTEAWYRRQGTWPTYYMDQWPDRFAVERIVNTYADRFANASVSVPFGTPCCRIEGGVSTCADSGNSTSTNTCAVGLPNAAYPNYITNRDVMVDIDHGVAHMMADFDGIPSSHLFEFKNNTIQVVHSIRGCGNVGCRTNASTRRGLSSWKKGRAWGLGAGR